MRRCFVFILMVFALRVFATDSISIIGTWYDDLGSPSYGDSTLIIEKDMNNYFISRRNGDGSGSRYRVKKLGNQFSKIGDKFGANYVITSKGLEIHDKAGYIRTAKKLK